MSRFRVSVLLLFVFLLCSTSPVLAAKWVFLGQRHVSDRAERDTVEVTALEGTFDAIKLHVKRAAVRFYRVTVIYGTGVSDDLELRDVIPAGGESRILDLRGGNRIIKRIEFAYEAKTLGHKGAVVEVYGRR